jgi:hypothetical protein
MTKVTVDSELWGKLENLQGPAELCDPSGRTLAYFYPVISPPSEETEQKSLIPDEELERRCREGGGRSLAEILSDLEKR